MGFRKDDLIRLPIIVLLDALVASRLTSVWQFGNILGWIISLLGISVCALAFSCTADVIVDIYSLILAALIHSAIHGWNFSLVLLNHQNYYGNENETSNSLITTFVESISNNHQLSSVEIDFVVKAAISFLVLQVLHYALLAALREDTYRRPVWYLVTLAPICALAFNLSRTLMICIIISSNSPVLLLLGQKLHNVRAKWMSSRLADRNEEWSYSVDNLIGWINTVWVSCRVPSVLRLYFIFKCVWAFIIINSQHEPFSSDSHQTTTKSGLYYYFQSSVQTPNEYNNWETMGGFFSTNHSRNLTIYEGVAVILTDSLLSSFAVGSAISVIGFYTGVGLHNFVGGNDIMQGEALGMMSSILFCLLSIQTGLSSLSPFARVNRLYRNSFLLLSAIMHFFLDVVHPVLMTISPQSHIPMKKHVQPLFICVLLLILPSVLCYWIITTKPISTWMIALTAFNIELIIKVLSTISVYALYVVDARFQTTGIINLDDYVFWIRSVSHVIEFICGLIMFVNGAYILFFESSNMLRAVMMSMHAYVNIYRTFREGLKTWNNRRTVNKRIASLQLINVSEIDSSDMDVCSICYQDFTTENGEIRVTQCKHMFHSSCLRKWIFIQDSCPMCDRALFPVEEKKNE